MNTYVATFSNGLELTRNSKRVYSHAYAVFNQEGRLIADGTGFSGSEESATKAAKGVIGFWANTYKTKELAKQFKENLVIEVVKVDA